ncbi:MAG: DUF3488 domain-containing protein [Deltaproteobacteria bacterium]|nr:DUF3488 domain-containing protein [Deltaproteobacteria bacterium]MBW2417733.1 DUF3488 domain-containing protein [Deltaproteobacteria bacterium]
MSRREFRASVRDPRPTSAWAMVLVASTTLWITGQVAPWAMAISLGAMAYSLTRRGEPRPWQSSPLLLNLAMGTIAAVTLALALRGGPSTIALAHFATLGQGLQLIDSRPRKSEFLLVALSLFQVILAANLTDSVFFPVLLLVYLAATTWTLMVHTLRSEAIEAGDATAATHAISRGLLRNTLLVTGLSVLLALAIFVTLPRMRSSVLHGASARGYAVAGFTNRVELGTIGRIRADSTVVLRVETLAGEAPPTSEGYWRGLAFDHFDGRSWSIEPATRSAPGGSPAFGISLGRPRARAPLVQRIVREPVQAGVLFGAGEARYLEGAVSRVELDANGALYSPGQANERIRYTIHSEGHHPDDVALARDETRTPERRGDRFLELPSFDPRVAHLAEEITRDLGNDAERVRALESWLRENGRYTDRPPDFGQDAERSPVEDFLLEGLSGHCEYFASALVVLARSAGLPARLVNGFAGGRFNELGDFVELTRSDAHAWVEVHYAEAGWVRYDPTPPRLRLSADAAPSLRERLAQAASAIELWWFQRVIDFDSSDQVRAVRSAWIGWQGLREPARAKRGDGTELGGTPGFGFSLPGRDSILVGLAAGLALLLQRIRRPSAAFERLVPSYAAALTLLQKHGLTRDPSTSARDFSERVSQRLPAPGAEAFERLTESYLAARFGARPSDPGTAEIARLKQHLGRRARSR